MLNPDNNLWLMILAEALFLTLVGIIVWHLITRQRLKKFRTQLEILRRDYKGVCEEKLELQKELHKSREQIKKLSEQLARIKKDIASTPPIKVPPPSASNDAKLLESYQLRIDNLERFKDLYFELEQQLDKISAADTEQLNLIDSLRSELAEQDQLIEDFRSQLLQLREKYASETAMCEQLEQTLDQLEGRAEKWKQQLQVSKNRCTVLEEELNELNTYRQRAQQLESRETKLQRELVDSRRRIKALEAQKNPDHRYGTVSVKEIDNLSLKLKQREQELRQLRQECETIGLQYEALATQSLDLASQNSELSNDQKIELELLRTKLEESNKALKHKQAEYEMLENYYLEMDDNSQNENTFHQINDSQQDLAALNLMRDQLQVQISTLVGGDQAVELEQLRDQLMARESELQRVRSDYQQIRQQFLEIAQEDNQLRERYDNLKAENRQLSKQLDQMQENQGSSTAKDQELAKLRDAYAQMEARYLATLEKLNRH